MPGRPSALSGVERTLVLGVYLVAAYALNVCLVGSWIPSGGDQGLWFLSVVAFFSFALLSAPFFTRPDDVIAAALASGLLLWSTAIPSVVGQRELEGLRILGLAYSVVALAVSGVASFSRRRPPERNPGIASATFRVSTTMGAPGALFAFPALLGAFTFSQAEPIKLGVQVAVWVLVVTMRPIEIVVEGLKLLREGSGSSGGTSVVGQISRVDSPNIVRLRISDRTAWDSSPVLATTLSGGGRRWLLPLFSQVQGGNVVGTGLCCKHSPLPTRLPAEGYVYQQESPPSRGELIKALTKVDIEAELIGFVVEDSSISRIRFEVAGGQTLQQGNLVFCGQGEAAVYYQILDARTAEETFEANPRGTHIVLAGQLGTPRTDRGFVRFGWVPEMNAPVFLAKERALPSDQTEATGGFQIGVVPGSDIPVMGSLEGMREHHTAILGMTGTGKTELALDIVRQAVEAGQKVICVDFTGEYRLRLADLDPALVGLDEEESKGLTAAVEAIEVGKYGAEDEKLALTSFLETVRPKFRAQVKEFLQADGAALAVVELTEIANTRATLRATELYLSTVFAWARANRQARRILLVLEEAHTIIPEMNVFGFDKGGTQAVVARMGQIALQGRKYGVGLLLISQRTALVSKTLLSQCNTVFSFALVDKTSLDYLSNVFSSEHVSVVSSLPSRQAVAHGVGVLSDRPIVVEIPFDQLKMEASEALRRPLDTAATVE